ERENAPGKPEAGAGRHPRARASGARTRREPRARPVERVSQHGESHGQRGETKERGQGAGRKAEGAGQEKASGHERGQPPRGSRLRDQDQSQNQDQGSRARIEPREGPGRRDGAAPGERLIHSPNARSAIWTALRAAPLRRLSDTSHREIAPGSETSARILPTS